MSEAYHVFGVDLSRPSQSEVTLDGQRLRGVQRVEVDASADSLPVVTLTILAGRVTGINVESATGAPPEQATRLTPPTAPEPPEPPETRYCRRPGCDNPIPWHTAKGTPLKPAQYAARTYCGQRCSGLVSGHARKVKASERVAAAEELSLATPVTPEPEQPAIEPAVKPADARYTRYCATCGKAIARVSNHGRRYFPSEYGRKKYCSRACAARSQTVEPAEVRHCVVCEKPIERLSNYGRYYTAKVYEGMKFCSRACAGTARRKEPAPEPEAVEEVQRATLSVEGRRDRLEAAKATRRGHAPIDADTVLAALEASDGPLTARGVVSDATGRINDGDLETVKRVLSELVITERVTRSRSANNQVVFRVARGVEVAA